MVNKKPKANASFHIVKRIIDVSLSFSLLLVLLPILILISIGIKLESSGPMFYVSQRMGKNGKPFSLFKFRTMYQDSPKIYAVDGSMQVVANDPRVTRLGNVLRIGFDELPQLFNILLGQMSLIGPRADPLEFLATYTNEERKRLSIRPGISGLAQVNGRTEISLDQRRIYDLAYVHNLSWQLETIIFMLTFFEILPFSRWGGRDVQAFLKRKSLEHADCSENTSTKNRRGDDV